MRSAEQKLKNMASAAEEHADIFRAQLDEKAEKAAARTPEEREMAHERRKAKESQAKMKLHQARARHVAEKLAGKQGVGHVYGHAQEPPAPADAYYGYGTAQPVPGSQGYQPVAGSQVHHQPVGTADPMTGTAVPTYPLGGHPTGHKYK